MSNAAKQSFKLVESVREHWADIMLNALIQNGHVSLSDDEVYKLKGELMQLLIGRVKV